MVGPEGVPKKPSVKRAQTRSNPLVGDKRSEEESPDLQGVSFLELKQSVSMCVIRFNETRSNSGRINKHMTIGFQDGMLADEFAWNYFCILQTCISS
jgi:hypothetical protein